MAERVRLEAEIQAEQRQLQQLQQQLRTWGQQYQRTRVHFEAEGLEVPPGFDTGV